MKRYNLIKNILIAGQAGRLYCAAVVNSVPAESKVFGLIAIVAATMVLLRHLDDYFERIRYRRKITDEQFARYENWLGEKVETQRAKGKDEVYLKSFIKNFVSHDTRFVFSMKQRWTLLKLATNEGERKNGQVCG